MYTDKHKKTLRTLPNAAVALVASAGLALPAVAQDSNRDREREANRQSQQQRQTDGQRQMDSARQQGNQQAQRSVYNFQKLSNVMGSTVESTDGTEVATIDDLIVDRGSGKVSHIVVLANDFLGFGGDRMAIPYGSFGVSLEEGTFLLPLTDKQIEDFGENVPAKWTRFESDDIRSELSRLHDEKDENFPSSIAMAMRDNPETKEIEGTIVSIDRSPATHGGQLMSVEVRADNDSSGTHTVVLGPTWYMSSQDEPLRRGDTVTIEAVQLRDNEYGGFAAKNIESDRGNVELWNDDGRMAWTDAKNKTRSMKRMAASMIIDADVRSYSETVGEIDDGILETGSGMIAMLLFDPNDNLFGIGDELKCVPWEITSFNGDEVRLDADKDTLEKCEPLPENLTVVTSTAALQPVYEVVGVKVAEFPMHENRNDATPNAKTPPMDANRKNRTNRVNGGG